MKTNRKPNVRRGAGFSLVEILIVITLLGLIGTMLTSVLVRQQRFHRAVTSMTDARARMRDVATILPTDLRGLSSIGGDLLAFSDTSLQFRAFLGTSILCDFRTTQIISIPPKVLASKNVISAWIYPPAANDIAFIYDEGTEAGNADDLWRGYILTATDDTISSTICPSSSTFTQAADNGAEKYILSLPSAPDQTKIKPGAPIRFAREVRYSVYIASDAQWYVGFQNCTPHASLTSPGTCGTREVLAGPVKAATTDTATSGLYFVFYNQTGGRVTSQADANTIASIGVGIRTTSESMRQAAATKSQTFITGGDSLRFTIGIRNRI
jgi:hypothetical protein